MVKRDNRNRTCAMSESMKILLLGDNYVGKTSMAVTYCGGEFPSKTIVTVGVNVHYKTVMIDNDEIKLQLYDTASQERFMDTILCSYTKDANALVFIYDITDILSFRFASNWMEACDNNLSNFSNMIKVLLGTKCDLEHQRQVSFDLAQKLAEKYEMKVYEVSSKSESNRAALSAVFETIAKQYWNEKLANKAKDAFDF